MDNSFKALIQSINAQLTVLNVYGFKIYDAESSEYFISKITYDSDIDEILFETLEDESKLE